MVPSIGLPIFLSVGRDLGGFMDAEIWRSIVLALFNSSLKAHLLVGWILQYLLELS
uniref:Uncharacterized protein n=1 Tax=Arundo donax TaxID=35708 RepID=A0A0A9C3E3_ARUDO